MIWFHLIVVLVFIVIGARLGGIGIGLAGAAGVLVLTATGVPTSTEDIPWDVIGIIMSVICTVAALEAVGGDVRFSPSSREHRPSLLQFSLADGRETWGLTNSTSQLVGEHKEEPF
ncbi:MULTISPECIES: anaerobic C4-dicarboxylate transporter family protein [Actinomyces]|uniref:anaerobic C4-dicarboxylate transporter family protein n=1 Tax=Actinomyces TaxID=1654 RepID=UPI001F420343|nr:MULTISPECIES: anaerobic C4-dicarboxylate transporter family protein [Actinomyces]